MGPGGHLGAKWSQEGKKVPKNVKNSFYPTRFEGYFGHFLRVCGALIFLMFFLKAFFLFPGPIKVPKGPERRPKGNPK